jgi:hypothetical protein
MIYLMPENSTTMTTNNHISFHPLYAEPVAARAV